MVKIQSQVSRAEINNIKLISGWEVEKIAGLLILSGKLILISPTSEDCTARRHH